MLIMDDIGYNLQAGIAVAQMPFPLTLAIIPFSPHAEEIAAVARAHGKEVIVHSPMASLDGRMVDPGGLVPGMSKAEFDNALLSQLAAVPFATGLNNHMGSLLTQQPQSMIWLMQMLKQHQLYFIDSRTTSATVAGETAMAAQVPTWQRDIFLDHDRDAYSINQQIGKLLPMAERKGLVVAIGHPYPETITALTETWQLLQTQGIEFVAPSHVLTDQLLARKKSLQRAIHP
ncbi:divergent polysaccharide deacetylase family protein [Halioxenophilus aromaticivorans]